jgi:hypothetical protein
MKQFKRLILIMKPNKGSNKDKLAMQFVLKQNLIYNKPKMV